MPSFLSSSTIRAKKSLKALAMGPKAQPNSEDITPLDCIFACSVCGDVFSDVYQQQDTAHGLSDGINPKERIVTRLYVASCCHVICIKHIEGGSGPAFHQAGKQPQAACPVCSMEKGDDTAKQLFSLRGFNEDQHDPAIPRCWFRAPPMKLEGKDKEMEALRFQYLALMRFSKNIAAAHRRVVKNDTEAANKLRSMQDLAAKEHAKAMSLQEELERLRPLEGEMQRLHRLEAKLPAIRHYLSLIPMLKEQNDLMQQRLASLGFAMSLQPIQKFNGPFPLDENGTFIADVGEDVVVEPQQTGSSHTVGRSAHNTGYGEELEDESSSSSKHQRPLKRSRVDSPTRASNVHAAPSSRDMMPPPAGRLPKLKSIRKMIPTLRNKFSTGRSSESQACKPTSDPDVQMYDGGQWEAVGTSPQSNEVNERPPTRHGLPPEDALYMSGALPAENGRPMRLPAHQQGLFSGFGIHSNESEFTFEAPSRMKMPSQRPGNLPTEPSYIRLFDGLGRHVGLDLGLEDPRDRNEHQPKHQMRQTQPRLERQQQLRQPAPRIQTQDHQKQWTFGHAFLEQSPVNVNSTSAQLHSALQYIRDGDAIINPRQDCGFLNPTTPAPIRSQRSADEVDHVVSPFFGSSSRHSQPFPRSQFAEPDISSNRSGTYPSHRHKPSTGVDWREPRSLNGLSFFNSPVNGRNERIELRWEPKPQEYMASLPQQRSRNINSQGLLMRPEAERSPMQHESTYGSQDRPYSRPKQPQSHFAIPFLSFSRPLRSRATATRLPSAMPSIISGRSSTRLRTGAEDLGKLGFRSSQRSRPRISVNTFASPMRPPYSSVGRRVIRR